MSIAKLYLIVVGNVAMVFRKAEKYIDKTYYNQKVIDGDMHDLRFLDRKNSIVGLSVKPNEYTKESNGFIIEEKHTDLKNLHLEVKNLHFDRVGY